MYKRIFKRNDGKDLIIFSLKKHIEEGADELEITPSSTPHLRWNPSRQEWVAYSENRSYRTSFPPKEYCPLCPSGSLNFPSEIPFNNFESLFIFSIEFHPTCGLLISIFFELKEIDLPVIKPKPLVSPLSVPVSIKSCIPKQIPNIGF